MSLGLTKTKRRISSIKNTQKITKAMEMVAMVKLRKGKSLFDANKEYLLSLEKAISALFYYDSGEKTHYSKPNQEAKGNLYIVVTSDMGLCAGYNSSVFKFVEEHVRKDVDYIAPLGAKGLSHFSADAGYQNIVEDYVLFNPLADNNEALGYAKKIKDDFNSGKYKAIILIYTHYVNSLKFEPRGFSLLPMSIPYEPKPSEEYCPPLFEPSPREAIHKILPRYLQNEIYGKVLESVVSEQASRRTAMESANDNADELLKKLTTEYNKARQGAITQEIVEVVSGANN